VPPVGHRKALLLMCAEILFWFSRFSVETSAWALQLHLTLERLMLHSRGMGMGTGDQCLKHGLVCHGQSV